MPKQKQKSNKLVWYISLIISALYLLNLTAGLDLIPDNFPIIGNLDEVGATALLLKSLEEIKQ